MTHALTRIEACTDIVIIGGGVSGVYAAYVLAKQPSGDGEYSTRGRGLNRSTVATSAAADEGVTRPKSIKLFESRWEIGGRFRSREMDGRLVELGAEYFTAVGGQVDRSSMVRRMVSTSPDVATESRDTR